jgi:hypothetical protein
MEAEFGGAGRGPQAPPGVYTLRLIAGEAQAERKVEVRLDPALKATPADLALQRDLGLKARDMTSAANTALRRLDSLKAQLRETERLGRTLTADEGKEWSKLVSGYVKELDAQTARLGIPLGGSRLEDAPELAEDLSGLLGQLTSGNSAPTPPQQTLLADYERRFKEAMAGANEFLTKTVAAWNESLRKAGAPTLAGAMAVELPR